MHLHQVVESLLIGEAMALNQPSEAHQRGSLHGSNTVHKHGAVLLMELGQQRQGSVEFGRFGQSSGTVIRQHQSGEQKAIAESRGRGASCSLQRLSTARTPAAASRGKCRSALGAGPIASSSTSTQSMRNRCCGLIQLSSQRISF